MNKGAATRQLILEKAFEIIYELGYQGTSVDRIRDHIQNTTPQKITKGAIYYHFENKEILGLAVIHEIIYPRMKQGLIDPLEPKEDPLANLYQTIEQFMLCISEEQLRNGCPTSNLIHEMAPLDARFRTALSRILNTWKAKIVVNLAHAADLGQIQAQDFEETAQFIIASYEGARGLGKLYRSRLYYESYLKQLKYFLDSL